MKIIIYTLTDPITNEVRYIGRTKKEILKYRLIEHLSSSKSNHNSYKKNWIKKLKNLNQIPTIEELETLNTTWEESHLVEKYWIQQFTCWGFKLVNLEDKGFGGYNKYKGHSDKAVLQYSLEGKFIKEYKSIREASRQTKIRSTTIEKVLWNICNTAGSFQWKYKTENYSLNIKSTKIKSLDKKRKPVFQYDLNNTFIKEWTHADEASKILNIRERGIRSCLLGYDKTFKGFIWKYKKI